MPDYFLTHEEEVLETSRGYIIKLSLLSKRFYIKKATEFPENYKFSWIAFNIDNPDERVLFDNHPGKPPHYHIDKKPSVYFKWISLAASRKLFFQKVYERFGYFDYE